MLSFADVTASGHLDGPEEESTSGASTTDSAHRGGLVITQTVRADTPVHRQLCNQLRELEDENKKLAYMQLFFHICISKC